jgi:DNA-binding transcriptional LysR family regulator
LRGFPPHLFDQLADLGDPGGALDQVAVGDRVLLDQGETGFEAAGQLLDRRQVGVRLRALPQLLGPGVEPSGISPTNDWNFRQGAKANSVRLSPRLTVSSNDAAIEAALQGFGITRLLSYQIAPQVERGGLKILLKDFEPPPMPIHVVHREGRYASVKIRSFVDLIVERLREDRALSPL